jgi:hypothetical protein
MFPGEVYDGLTSDGLAEMRTLRLLRYIGYPPVGDLIVILVALTPIPRASPLYTAASTNRWKYFEALSKSLFLLKLTEIVVNPMENCRLDEYVTPEQHCSSAAQTLQELIEKLSIEEIGEIVLQPLGYTPSLIESLLDCALSTAPPAPLSPVTGDGSAGPQQTYEGFLTSRRVSLRILSFLLKKSINNENICFVSGPNNNPIATLVPNRLFPLRPLMLQTFLSRLKDLEQAIIGTAKAPPSLPGGAGAGETTAVSHPGHKCDRPFSSHRSQLIELFVLILEGSAAEMGGGSSFLGEISVECWKLLIQWNFEYAHNNIYHSMFYRLLFAMLRQNNEKTLKAMFKSAKLLRHFLDAFDCSEDEEIAAKLQKSLSVSEGGNSNGTTTGTLSSRLSSSDKKSLRGFVINCCNAIRLQVSSHSSLSPLTHALTLHSTRRPRPCLLPLSCALS